MNGVAISTQNIAIGLREMGVDVHVYAPAPPGYDISDSDPYIHWLSSVKHKPTGYAIALPVFRRHKQRRRQRIAPFDLIHTQHQLHVGLWGKMVAKFYGLPLVNTYHTQLKLYAEHIPLFPARWTYPFLDYAVRRYCQGCDLVTTPGAGARERLLDLKVETPIKVIYNPIDLKPYQEASGQAVRQQLGCQPDDPIIGYVGRLSSEKNLEALVKATAVILPVLPKLRIVIVGDGPSRSKLEHMASALPDATRIHFVGRKEQREVPLWVAAFDVFCSPSPSEVQPLSFAEAMAARTAMVVMGVPGGEEMVRDGLDGRLVPWRDNWGDGEELARILAETLQSASRLQEMKSNAAASAQRYDKLSICRQWLETYEEVIRARKRVH